MKQIPAIVNAQKLAFWQEHFHMEGFAIHQLWIQNAIKLTACQKRAVAS